MAGGSPGFPLVSRMSIPVVKFSGEQTLKCKEYQRIKEIKMKE